MALVSSTELTRALPGTDAADAALVADFQAAAEAFVAAFCGRDFAGGTFTEDFPAGTRALILRNYPVTAVTSVSAGGVPLDATGYSVNAERGVVTIPYGPRLPGGMSVTYTTATDAVPPAAKQAVKDLVGHWVGQAKTAAATGQLNVGSVTAADGTATQYPWSQSTGMHLPPAVTQLLAPLRSPRI